MAAERVRSQGLISGGRIVRHILIVTGVVTNFAMTYVMLWASAEITGRRKIGYRLLLGAVTASAFLVVILLLVGTAS